MTSALFHRVRLWFVELNLFESGREETETVRRERWSTRIYLVLLIAILFVMALYKGLGNQTSQITVKRPSQALFESLDQKYPNTLYCPCSTIAINYATFIRIQPTYHQVFLLLNYVEELKCQGVEKIKASTPTPYLIQMTEEQLSLVVHPFLMCYQVCSSSFITQDWISATYIANLSYIWSMDARRVASAYAQFLRSFCKWGHMSLGRIVNESLASFFINSQALSSSNLQSKVDEALGQTRRTGPLLMTEVLLGIRFTAMGNQLMSGLSTETFIFKPTDGAEMAAVGINAYQMLNGSTCYCYSINKCLGPAAVYSNHVEPTFGVYHLNANGTLVKGMQTACYPLEGVMASTLECYFDSSCLQLLVGNSTPFTPLDSTRPSRFPPNTTVKDLLYELMAEQWSFDVFPEDYYIQCAPLTCTYSYTHRNTVLSITTTIITIFGGLSIALQLMLPWFIQLMLKMRRKFTLNAVDPSQMALTWAKPAAVPVKAIMRKYSTFNGERGSFQVYRRFERPGSKV